MLKHRVIPTLLYKGTGLVKGVAFDSSRRVGTALPTVRVYRAREVDELVFLDIAATAQDRIVDLEELDDLADECFMPLTVGGGVKTAKHFEQILRAGADKVAVNSGAIDRPELISQAAASFGTQCVVLSIDARRIADGRFEVFSRNGSCSTGLDPVEWSRHGEGRGAGEILLTSVDRDGTMLGYDIGLVRSVTEAVSIPVIASGGAGSYEDMRLAVQEGGASAVAAASIFLFTEQTPLEAKRYLSDSGIPVRLH